MNKGSNQRTKFLSKEINYDISVGYIYPIFGAFRYLISFENGTIKWSYPPIEIWEDIGAQLVQNTFDSSNNPQLAGKDKRIWLTNLRIVENKVKALDVINLQEQLRQLQSQKNNTNV